MTVIEETADWIERMVIGLNLCPFAAQPLRQGKVVILETDTADIGWGGDWLMERIIEFMDQSPNEVETTLLVFSNLLSEFYYFMDLVYWAEDQVEDSEASQFVQLAHFHPQYQFADSEPDDPANRSNRSPYPTIQLLRAASVAEAVDRYPDAGFIPQRNVEKLRKYSSNDASRSPNHASDAPRATDRSRGRVPDRPPETD